MAAPAPEGDVKGHRSLLFVVVVVGALYRLWSAEGFWIDEVFTGANVVAGPFSYHDRILVEPHSPWPLYYGLVWLWAKAFSGVWGLKAFSVVVSLLGVGALGLLAARFFGPKAGWFAALLAATNPMLAWYGGEARMYALWLLAYTGAMAAAFRVEGRDRLADGLLFALAGCATVFVHQMGAFPVLALGIWVLARGGRRTRIGAIVGTIVLIAPGIPVTVEQVRHWLAWKGSVGPPGYVAGPGNLAAAALAFFTAYAVPLHGFAPARIVAAVVVAVAVGTPVVVAWRARLPRVRFLLLLAALALVGPYLLMIRTRMFSPRFTLLALPPLLVVAASGFLRVRPVPAIALLVSLFVLAGACVHWRAGRTDWREVAAVLERERKPGETLTFDGGNLAALREWFGPAFDGESSTEPADWTIRFPAERPEEGPNVWTFGPEKRLIEDESPVLRRHPRTPPR